MFSTDLLFFGATAFCGIVYLYYAVTRRNDEHEFRKPIVFWRDLFLITLAVFILRGFFWDMRIIPSNSMQPTLKIGDRILVDKNQYGHQLPVLNIRLSAGEKPQNGDIIVFRHPKNGVDYIKRIIGIPGDIVNLQGNTVIIDHRKTFELHDFFSFYYYQGA